MPKSGEKKEDKMDEMVGWPDHIITYYIVGKLRLTMGGEIIYEEAFLMSCMYILTIYLPDIYAVDTLHYLDRQKKVRKIRAHLQSLF